VSGGGQAGVTTHALHSTCRRQTDSLVDAGEFRTFFQFQMVLCDFIYEKNAANAHQ
jgi:hypothetical protein